MKFSAEQNATTARDIIQSHVSSDRITKKDLYHARGKGWPIGFAKSPRTRFVSKVGENGKSRQIPTTVLTEAKVKLVRFLKNKKHSCRKIAAIMGVRESVVRTVL